MLQAAETAWDHLTQMPGDEAAPDGNTRDAHTVEAEP